MEGGLVEAVLLGEAAADKLDTVLDEATDYGGGRYQASNTGTQPH